MVLASTERFCGWFQDSSGEKITAPRFELTLPIKIQAASGAGITERTLGLDSRAGSSDAWIAEICFDQANSNRAVRAMNDGGVGTFPDREGEQDR
jgi:hypothetical protein